jgi:hypothetical protein
VLAPRALTQSTQEPALFVVEDGALDETDHIYDLKISPSRWIEVSTCSCGALATEAYALLAACAIGVRLNLMVPRSPEQGLAAARND